MKATIPSPISPKPTRKSLRIREIQHADHSALSIQTPEKAEAAHRRTGSRRIAFSLTEVREIAKGLQTSSKGVESKAKEEAEPVTIGCKRKRENVDTKLPEKYEELVRFFEGLESSIRLFQLRQSMATFSSISKSIESLTERRFSYAHLAQLKYILKEAIDIKKILVRDEKTLCMKPELQIKLQLDAFRNELTSKSSGSLDLRKKFRARLLDFFKAHPGGVDVPREELPYPFNHRIQNPEPNSAGLSESILLPSPCESLSPKPPVVASHLPQSFRRRFSQRVPVQKLESQLNTPATPLEPVGSSAPETCSSDSPIKLSSPKTLSSRPSLIFGGDKIKSKLKGNHSMEENHVVRATPPKLVSTPLRLMTRTPEMQPTKRSNLTPGDSPAENVRRFSRPRSLNFLSPVKNAEVEPRREERATSTVADDVLKLLPETIWNSVRERERKAVEDRGLGLAEARKRKRMIAHLPRLFDMICLMFQSANKSVMTKRELISQIMAQHVDITDTEEIEEQLKLLQESLPDWISNKKISSGETVFCINKALGSDKIHARLAEVQ